jgi:hypothetical protein
MEHIAVSVVSWLFGVLLGQYGRDIGLILTGWYNSDIPKLTGRWLSYGARTPESKSVIYEEFREHVTLTQVGRLIFGEISPMDASRVYRFRGRIVRNGVIATFHLVGRGQAAGTGSFQFIAGPEDQVLIGKSVWQDHRDNEIASADYVWLRSQDDEWRPRITETIKGGMSVRTLKDHYGRKN